MLALLDQRVRRFGGCFRVDRPMHPIETLEEPAAHFGGNLDVRAGRLRACVRGEQDESQDFCQRMHGSHEENRS